MEHIAVAAEVGIVIASHFVGKTVGDCNMADRTAHISTVQSIQSVLEMKQVGAAVLRSGLLNISPIL